MRIQKTDSLIDIEMKLATVTGSGNDQQEMIILLPRDIGRQFFKESRLSSIVLTAVSSRKNVKVRDYESEWPSDYLPNHFGTTIIGVTAARISELLENARGQPVPLNMSRTVIHDVIRRGGLLEGDPKRTKWENLVLGNRISICCFDPENIEPGILRNCAYDVDHFRLKMMSLRAHLEAKKTRAGISFDRTGPNAQLMKFIFELYQNSYEHGRYAPSGSLGLGFRFIHMRKYIGKKSALLRRAAGFEALEAYIDESIPRAEEREHRFYEVSVSDTGPGIIEGFRAQAAHAQLNFDFPEDQLELLNQLIFSNLSSKLDKDGAGWGLQNALKAAKDAAGFVTLRTGRYWLYGSFSPRVEKHKKNNRLYEVPESMNLGNILGTQFNILLPLPV